MDTRVSQEEENNKRKSIFMSTGLHVLLIILAFIPFLTYPDPPPGQPGILVNLGMPDVGQGEENARQKEVEETTTAEEKVVEEPTKKEEVEKVKPKPEKKKKKKTETKKKKVITSEDPAAVALKKEKARKAAEKAEAERKAQEAAAKKAEEERKAREAAEKARKAREAEIARKKREGEKFGEDLGGAFGNGKGKGNTGKPGNQGDPSGDPNANNTVGKGSGTVHGFGNRGFQRPNKIKEKFPEEGVIIVKVCVNKEGKILSANYKAKYTSGGHTYYSTSTNPKLIQLAEKNAKRYKFKRGTSAKQCGMIEYHFKFD